MTKLEYQRRFIEYVRYMICTLLFRILFMNVTRWVVLTWEMFGLLEIRNACMQRSLQVKANTSSNDCKWATCNKDLTHKPQYETVNREPNTDSISNNNLLCFQNLKRQANSLKLIVLAKLTRSSRYLVLKSSQCRFWWTGKDRHPFNSFCHLCRKQIQQWFAY